VAVINISTLAAAAAGDDDASAEITAATPDVARAAATVAATGATTDVAVVTSTLATAIEAALAAVLVGSLPSNKYVELLSRMHGNHGVDASAEASGLAAALRAARNDGYRSHAAGHSEGLLAAGEVERFALQQRGSVIVYGARHRR
jgi:hypothetical protein